MSQVVMTDAVAGTVAVAAEYNKITANVRDLATTSAGGGRVGALETVTTDTSGTVGIGNQRLSDRLGAGVTTAATADARFGSGVGTGSNVNTGSAASQLTDLRSRLDTGVGTGSNVTTGSATAQLTDLRSRMTTAETTLGTLSSGVMVRLTRATDQVLTTGGATENPISWSAATNNASGMWALSPNPTRIVIPTGQTGLYQVIGQVVIENNATGSRGVHLRINGLAVGSGGWRRVINLPNAGSGEFTEFAFSYTLQLSAADYFEVNVTQVSGGNLNLKSTDGSPNVFVRRVA